MSIISKPRFPNVPNLPGVPQLLRSPLFPPGLPPALGLPLVGKQLWQSLTNTPQWGIFDAQNNPVLEPDSFLSVEVRNESQIPTFPVQAGSFASYNKVQTPQDVSIRVSRGGTQADRTTFLRAIEFLLQSLALLTVLTPELTYQNMQLMRYEVTRRGAQGAYFLAEVELFFREIRQVTPQYVGDSQATENAKNPSAVGPVSEGQVQAKSLPARLTASVTTALRNLVTL